MFIKAWTKNGIEPAYLPLTLSIKESSGELLDFQIEGPYFESPPAPQIEIELNEATELT